jgi:hypothetical protein
MAVGWSKSGDGGTSMEAKDWITLLGIGATLIVAGANLVYNMITSRRMTFVNAVTTSRVKWIETVRERVATLVGLTHHWPVTPLSPDESQLSSKNAMSFAS